VLRALVKLIEDYGRLDIDNPRNSPIHFPGGAYSELEYLLLKLTTLSEMQPRANLKYKIDEAGVDEEHRPAGSLVGVAVDKIEIGKRKRGNPQNAGKGWGTNADISSDFNAESYFAAARARDAELEMVLEKILEELKTFVPGGGAVAPGEGAMNCTSAMEVDGEEGLTRANSGTADWLGDASAGTLSEEEFFNVLEESCLVPFLELQLRNESVQDMMARESLYLIVASVVRQFVERPITTGLLLPLEGQAVGGSLVALMKRMKRKANDFLKVLGKGTGKPCAEVVLCQAMFSASEAIESLGLVDESVEEGRSNKGPSPLKPPGEFDEAELDAEYLEVLGPMRVLEADDEAFEGHHYPVPSGTPPQDMLLRLAAEIGTLQESLPCSIHSAAMVCVHEEHCDWMKVIIAGAQGTPYESGLFEYHILCPSTGGKHYPDSNPLCNLETTGGGYIRFNPNLYNCGKVCLTLLGTWRGAPGEGWTKASSLHQLIISISAMVMTDEPHYNEPGYEQEAGTDVGIARNLGYVNKVRWGTLKYAILGQLQNPSKGFEDAVREHFRIKKPLILQQLDRWEAEAANGSADYSHTQDRFTAEWNKPGKYQALLKEQATAVRAELAKL